MPWMNLGIAILYINPRSGDWKSALSYLDCIVLFQQLVNHYFNPSCTKSPGIPWPIHNGPLCLHWSPLHPCHPCYLRPCKVTKIVLLISLYVFQNRVEIDGILHKEMIPWSFPGFPQTSGRFLPIAKGSRSSMRTSSLSSTRSGSPLAPSYSKVPMSSPSLSVSGP